MTAAPSESKPGHSTNGILVQKIIYFLVFI